MPNLIYYALNMLSLQDVQESFRLTEIQAFKPSIMNSLKQALNKEKNASTSDPSNDKSTPDNRLVEMGIIPASEVEILIPPPEKPSMGKQKISGARLITDPQTLITPKGSSSKSNNASKSKGKSIEP